MAGGAAFCYSALFFAVIVYIFNHCRVSMEKFRFVPAIQRRSDWDYAKHTRPIPEIIVFFSPVNFPDL